MVNMLEGSVASGSGRPTWYGHRAGCGRVHAMGAHVRGLAARAPNATVRTYYNVPGTGDVAGRGYDEPGFIDTERPARERGPAIVALGLASHLTGTLGDGPSVRRIGGGTGAAGWRPDRRDG